MPCPSAAKAAGYRRREPENGLLYRIVSGELDALRAELAEASPYGNGLPRHVDKELEAYLRCGILAHGFARVVCRSCHAEHLVGFSCKGRGVCPSCTTRRMHDCAAHLVDRVLPRTPMRQWVVTFPRRVRYHLAADPRLASEALREVLRTIFAYQRRHARRIGARPSRARSNGAVTFVQRFNSALELSLHFHVLVPDGIFVGDGDDPDARPRFVELDPPTDQDVAALLDRIRERVVALLRRRGRLDDEAVDDPPEPHLLLAARPAKRNGQPFVEVPLPRRCVRKDGFSLHAGIAVHANDRLGLERLARYGLRPALALDRLTCAADGSLLYLMKRRFSDGRHLLRFTPRELLLRLCALVPPRRFHMVRYAGIFSAHARGRHALTGRGLRDLPPETMPPPVATPMNAGAEPPPELPAPAPPPPTVSAAPTRPRDPDADPDPAPLAGPDDPTRARRLEWSTLMKRAHQIDVLVCPRCAGSMRLVALIEDERIAKRILTHLGLQARPPPRGRPWRPAQSHSLDPTATAAT
jgi:hypothetical protein